MMRKRAIFGTLLAGALVAPGLVASPAAAQGPDIRDVRPVVTLLVDSSGSMEREPSCVCQTVSCNECYPSCGASPERNRWATVVEAMTGSWTTFSCTREERTGVAYSGEPDYHYYIPHFRTPPITDPQLNDGILDAYLERVKFGLMTFDPVGTFTGSDPLVRQTVFNGRLADNASLPGAFSYGVPRPFTIAGCAGEPYMIDNGARNASATSGRLVSVGDDSTSDYRLINRDIQDTLKTIRPYGATPIAGMLDDFQYYLANDPDVAPRTSAGGPGDPYASCRSRFAILLTDGYPNADMRESPYSCGTPGYTCPYQTPEDISAALCDYDTTIDACDGPIDGLFVVGFAIDDPAAVGRLNDIADMGGTGEAFFASDRAELMTALSTALDRVAPGTTTRTVPAFGSVGSGTATQHQLQFSTGFRVRGEGKPWEGVLERRRVICDGTTPVAQPIDSSDRFDQILNARATPRRLLTILPSSAANTAGHLVGVDSGIAPLDDVTSDSGTGDGVVARGSGGRPAGCGATPPAASAGIAESGLELVPFNTSVAPEYFGLSTSLERDAVVAWVHGSPAPAASPTSVRDAIAARQAARFGDVYHSSPYVLGPPVNDLADEGFNLFGQANQSRPTVVLVGTNDGILHCIAAEDATFTDSSGTSVTVTAGDELWGFIPPALLRKLPSALSSHQWGVDGTPIVKDVFYRRLPGDTSSGSIWRTIVLIGMRDGAPGYIALDLTRPEAPVFLWQFTHPDMGYGRGAPGLAQVLVDGPSGLEERAVALLPSGAGSDLSASAPTCGPRAVLPDGSLGLSTGCVPTGKGYPAQNPGTTTARTRGRCWDRAGRQLFFVDVATGRLIRMLDDEVFNAPLTGGVGLFSGDVATIASQAFVTDSDGVMWRVDMGSSDPEDWDADAVHDLYWNDGPVAGQPAPFPPVISTDSLGRLVVVQATGDIDRLDAPEVNHVVSTTICHCISITGLTEECTPSSARCTSGGAGAVVTAAVNWDIPLELGEQVTGPLELFDSKVYFGTFRSSTSDTDQCQYGDSRLWGVEYRLPDPADTDIPRMAAPALESVEGSGVFDSQYIGPFSNQIIMGVAISQAPNCVRGGPATDNFVAPGANRFLVEESGGGNFQLVANVSGGTREAGSQISRITRDLPPPLAYTRFQALLNSVD